MSSSPAASALLRIASAGAVILAAWLWLASRDEQRRAEVVHDETSAERSTSGRDRAALAPDLGAHPGERILPSGEPRTESEPASAPVSVLVRGTLVLADGAGARHPRGSGQFELSTWGPSLFAPSAADVGEERPGVRERLRRRLVTSVEVVDGRWQVLLPEHTARRFAHGRLDGQPLFDLRAEELEDGDPGVIELRVTGRALHPARIFVVDAETLRELDGVTVVACEAGDPPVQVLEREPLIAAATSPLEIPAPDVDRRTYLIGAKGHAWQRLEWDHLTAGTSRVVELERAGALAVHVEGDCPREECVVTLTIDGAPYARVAAAGPAPLRFPEVAPGAYRVALVPRAGLVEAQVPILAEAPAMVVAGEVAEVGLQAFLGARPQAVGLTGRIQMSSAWSVGGPHVVLRALGRSALWHMDTGGLLAGVQVQPQGGTWTFRSPAALAGGRYLLTERRTWFMREVEVGPRGSLDWPLEIPDPLTVLVEVGDRTTGATIPECELAWLPPTPAGMPQTIASGPLWITPERAGRFRARVPAWDRLEFEARAPGYAVALAELRPVSSAPVDLWIALDRR